MDNASLLHEVTAAHAELERRLATLTEGQITRSRVHGEMSVKDVLAHLAAWERMDAGWINASLRGETVVRYAPGFELAGAAHDQLLDRLNQHIYQQNKDRPLPEVLDDLRTAQAEILSTVRSLSNDDITDPHRFDWWDGEPVSTSVAGNSPDHYHEHLTLIEAWRP